MCVAFSLEFILEPVSEVPFQKLQLESALWIPDPKSEGGRFEQIVERFLRKIITVPAQLTHLAEEVSIEVMTDLCDLDHLCTCTEGKDEAQVCPYCRQTIVLIQLLIDFYINYPYVNIEGHRAVDAHLSTRSESGNLYGNSFCGGRRSARITPLSCI